MRKLVVYLRQVFCKHEFTYEEGKCKIEHVLETKEGIKIYKHCKKCSYHNSYWKF